MYMTLIKTVDCVNNFPHTLTLQQAILKTASQNVPACWNGLRYIHLPFPTYNKSAADDFENIVTKPEKSP